MLTPFAEMKEKYNIDANRWYLEAVGSTCEGVQAAATSMGSTRLAGLVLRGPTKAVTSPNSALVPTLVVHAATSAEGKAVAEAYKKIDDKNNAAIEVPDPAAVSGPNDQVVAWCDQHKRSVPSSYTFVTTMTETSGENWTSTMEIVVPGKYGEPTKVGVKYLRDSNTVDITCENLGEFHVYMNDDLLDLDKEVTIVVNGTQLAKKTFPRDHRAMLKLAIDYCELGRYFPACYRGVVPKIVAPPAPPPPPVNPPGGNPPPPTPPANPPGGDKKDGGTPPAPPK
jgi:hypothetical protein